MFLYLFVFVFCYCFFFFFFSSRRRHTRWPRDWSSDVCSSDLVPIGEEAVLRPQEFSLEGRAIRKVRQSVSRLRKAGYSFRLVAADEIGPELAAELADVSASWRGGEPERGFSMAIDDLHVPGTVLALAEDSGGDVGGFLHLAPSP